MGRRQFLKAVVEANDVSVFSDSSTGKSLNDLMRMRSTWGPEVLVVGLVHESVIQRWAVMISLRQPTTSSDDIEVNPHLVRYPGVRGETPRVPP